MTRSRPFTAFSPVALRLGVCAIVAACVILPVTPPSAAGDASETRKAPSERAMKADRLLPQAELPQAGLPQAGLPCSARHWDHEATCYLPATTGGPARSVRIVTFERRDGNVSILERRTMPFDAARR